ncbi:hypothetical protein GA0115239_118913, partial [Streptomyces sp. BpilaLS-43]
MPCRLAMRMASRDDAAGRRPLRRSGPAGAPSARGV